MQKDYQQYYRQKAIPQLKELLTNYGPLGIIWFDTPGGMTKQQTQNFINELRVLQPKSLFSSRVGHGLGDYVDFGDSEIPAAPVNGAWESIFTHNDSWGYIQHDFNFKSSEQIIHILSEVASKGGNLMLNVGPDGKGNFPYYSVKYLKETGAWLKKNGESIYGSTYGFIPKQTWGVTTAKPGKLFLHVWNRPFNEKVLVPGFSNQVSKVYTLVGKKALPFSKKSKDLDVDMSSIIDNKSPNTVIVVEYSGKPQALNSTQPITVSSQYAENIIDAVFAKTTGKANVKKFTHSSYFGVWHHTTCVADMKSPEDSTSFAIRITEPGDYKLTLEYSCADEDSKQEGVLTIGGKKFMFETLRTAKHETWKPMLFIKHAVAIFSTDKPGLFNVTIRPYQKGKELFKLKSIIVEPIK
ncbi:alpha-L-fucosidase [Niabella ginsengisoli]|uniref:alpha-L-fucosidase n=1 Tax=Niabella ginsengisoli TaxID=522298 RepID=UPI00293E7B14|nr:alpha-L-fucosidase [Niabella ginsengisoli]